MLNAPSAATMTATIEVLAPSSFSPDAVSVMTSNGRITWSDARDERRAPR